PLNDRLARRMLESLRLWPLLNGYRGRPPLDVEALIETLVRLSYLIAEQPRITELDINPLLVLPRGVLALDARVVMAQRVAAGERPYAHLAIRPYPDEFGHEARLDDGTPLQLRAIRAEDEPAWLRLLQRCTPETLRARFGGAFKLPSHAVAARYCIIDYDRELALVAERREAGQSELLGVVRLVADPDRQTAEFAILVEDAWQSHGVGGILARHAVACARDWGVTELRGETEAGNLRMRRLFAELGFTEETSDPLRPVVVRRGLNPTGS
ncbi:MAG: GNAT family N-acetyltransferase, partial [Planctomycetaceae bacterium]